MTTIGTVLTNSDRMTVGTTGRLEIDEHLLNRCVVALVAAVVLWLVSLAFRNFRG